MDLYQLFLTQPGDPKSIDASRLANGINHPTNAHYERMAEEWLRGIEALTAKSK